MLIFGPQVMNRPTIGDNEQDNQHVQDTLFAKRLVSPVCLGGWNDGSE